MPPPRTSQRRGRVSLPRRRLTGFTVARRATWLSSSALFGVSAGSLQLTVNDNESWFCVSFHEYRLSSSFFSLFRTSMIDFGIILGRASIIIIQKSRWQEFSVHSIRHYSVYVTHFVMWKYERKTILLASYLHDFILFLIKNIISEICVLLYVSSVKYSQSTHINLLYKRQFRWYRIYIDVVQKVGNFIILPLFHIVSAN